MDSVKLAQLREKNVQLEQAHRYDVVVQHHPVAAHDTFFLFQSSS